MFVHVECYFGEKYPTDLVQETNLLKAYDWSLSAGVVYVSVDYREANLD